MWKGTFVLREEEEPENVYDDQWTDLLRKGVRSVPIEKTEVQSLDGMVSRDYYLGGLLQDKVVGQ